MIKVRKNYRLKNETIGYLESICKSTCLTETEALEKSVEEYHNLLKNYVHTIVHTPYIHHPQSEVISPTPIHTGARTPDSNVFNISDRGLKGGNSFLDENGQEIPLPPSSPELDAKQKEIESDWKREYEESLKRRGIKP